MKLTKLQLQKLIQEEVQNLSEQPFPPTGKFAPKADPEFSLKSDLESAETRASSRESSRDILLDGMREIEKIAEEAGYEDILDVIHRTSPDHAEGSPDPDNPYD